MQLLRVEVFHRGCMRAALPAQCRERISNAAIYSTMRCASVATLLERRQLRTLGHLARLEKTRVPAMMAIMGRIEPGRGAAGCRGSSLLGASGDKGALTIVLDRALTRAAVGRSTLAKGWRYDRETERRGSCWPPRRRSGENSLIL